MLRTALPRALLLLLCFASMLPQAAAYSVLTHEQIVDLAWDNFIQPLLLARYPHTSRDALREAHAYAYGGCAIQDMGYYPFGKEFFSDLTHYVRTGDFVMHLVRDVRTVDEYAFALGALSHYIGDNIGHHDAINHAAALSFPKLFKKFGPVVTYDQDPRAHVRTEFAFDVEQLSKRRLAPAAYLRFVGLRVSRRLLEQAFADTYALRLREVLGPEVPAIRSYRTAVRSLIPRVGYAETLLHRHDFPPDPNDREFALYLERLNQTEFQKVWSKYRRQPAFTTRLLAIVIRIVPKLGPASVLAIAIPNPQTDSLYITSLNRSIVLYSSLLQQMRDQPEVIPFIPDRDLDTGETTRPGSYARADATYAKLLRRVTADPSRSIPADLKQDLLHYYADPHAPIRTKKNAPEWRRVLAGVAALQNMPTGPVTDP